jgi:hypothetical protein
VNRSSPDTFGSEDPENDARYQSSESEGINQLAFEQGLRGLDDQNSTLSNIRQRANGVAALSGLAATFFGREMISRSQSATSLGFSLAAVFFFVISIAAVILIYRPRGGWVFHFSASKIINQFSRGERATTLSRTFEELGKFCEKHHSANSLILSKLFRLLQIALACVVLQILCWITAYGIERGGPPW